MIDKVELMKCRECKQERIKTDTGICVLCSAEPKGEEIEITTNQNTPGTEIKSKTGDSKCRENTWMSKK